MSHPEVPGLLQSRLKAGQRQARTSRLLRITPEGIRDIRGERDHCAGWRELLASAGLLSSGSAVGASTTARLAHAEQKG